MSFTQQVCEICQRHDAAVFMVMRQGARVAKAHVCFTCFTAAESKRYVTVEGLSLQEFEETRETWQEMKP